MKNTESKLDMEALIKQMGEEVRSGKPLTGTGGVFTPLVRDCIAFRAALIAGENIKPFPTANPTKKRPSGLWNL